MKFLLFGVLLTTSLSMAATIKIGGGAAPINNIFKRIQVPFEQKSKHKLELSEQGPDVAMMDLDQGKLDLATAGLDYQDWLKMMEEKKYTFKTKKEEFKARVIGRDLIQVYVNPDVALNELTKEQLRDIFTGRTTNWKAVGGSDSAITVVFGEKIPGTNKVWSTQIMESAPWPKAIKKVGTASDVAKAIADTKGAIGIGPIGLNTKDILVRTVKIPVVGRPIVAVTMGKPKQEIFDLFDFIVENGKEFTKE